MKITFECENPFDTDGPKIKKTLTVHSRNKIKQINNLLDLCDSGAFYIVPIDIFVEDKKRTIMISTMVERQTTVLVNPVSPPHRKVSGLKKISKRGRFKRWMNRFIIRQIH